MSERECCSGEIHAIEFIAALDCQLRPSERYIKDRLKSIPGAWQKYRTAMVFIEKVLDDIYATVPKKVLINKAIEGECSMCLNRGPDVRHCALRRALMNIVPPEALQTGSECPYQDAALKCKMGEYI